MKSANPMFLMGLIAALALGFGHGIAGHPSTATAATSVQCGDVITMPGHYILTSDLSCPGNGVDIATNDVDFNLAGHTISGTSSGHGIGVIAGVCLALNASNVDIHGGTVTGFGDGIFLCNVSGAHLNGLNVTGNQVGVHLLDSDGNHINGNVISSEPAQVSVHLFDSNGNEFNTNVVRGGDAGYGLERSSGNLIHSNDISGNGDMGVVLRSADGNVITSNNISGNARAGVLLVDSSGNTLKSNTVNDTHILSTPGTNIALIGDSDSNVIQGNTASSTGFGTAQDGINVGCRGGCPFFPQSVGADNNLIQSNTANNNARYGIAQAAGNCGNVYVDNKAAGNGSANFAIDNTGC